METNILGAKVVKKSGKPFKSGKKVGTVKWLCVNPNTHLPAFIFEEDESIVDQRTCAILKPYTAVCHKTFINASNGAALTKMIRFFVEDISHFMKNDEYRAITVYILEGHPKHFEEEDWTDHPIFKPIYLNKNGEIIN